MSHDRIFVVQEHHASQRHFDFRLEIDGVLKSWAIPKGPSLNPNEKRLAIMVDDHTLAYGSFEGVIPDGRYGAGPVVIWDTGTYQLQEGTDPAARLAHGALKLHLKGKRLQGGFTLAKMRGRGATGKEWLLKKQIDEYADPDFILRSVLVPAKRQQLRMLEPPCETS